jgi:hypothetical protein
MRALPSELLKSDYSFQRWTLGTLRFLRKVCSVENCRFNGNR